MSAFDMCELEPAGHIFGHRTEDVDGARQSQVSVNANPLDMSPQQLGHLGEALAEDYLKNLGWDIAEKNWTCASGEADLIAYDGDMCVLVEVKTRLEPNARCAMVPELAVTPAKQRRYRGIAECYRSYAGPVLMRFDVIAVSVVANGTAHLHHIESAFGSDL